MPTRKLDDDTDLSQEPRPCLHPEHNPPRMRVFTPGLYEYECPACHQKVTFRVRRLGWLRAARAWRGIFRVEEARHHAAR